jgi:hypothetical protein
VSGLYWTYRVPEATIELGRYDGGFLEFFGWYGVLDSEDLKANGYAWFYGPIPMREPAPPEEPEAKPV